MPTLLERTGDFSQSIGAQGPVTIYDPLTGSPFPGNIIPQNRHQLRIARAVEVLPGAQRAGIQVQLPGADHDDPEQRQPQLRA